MGVVGIPGGGGTGREGIVGGIVRAAEHGGGKGAVGEGHVAGFVAVGDGAQSPGRGGAQRQRAGADDLVHVNGAIGQSGHQLLEVGHVLVGDLHVLLQQAHRVQEGANLLDLQNLLRRHGGAVDGQRAYAVALGDALGQGVKVGACAVLPDIQRHHVAVFINDTGVIQQVQIRSGPLLVAAIHRRKAVDQRLIHLRGGRDGQHGEHHDQRQEQRNGLLHSFCHIAIPLFSLAGNS